MKRLVIVASILAFTACGKKKDGDKAPPKDEPKGSDTAMKKDEPPPKDDPKKLPEVEMVEHDLAPFGKEFTGWVVTAPKTAKLEFDDPSRHIVLSEEDFITIGDAPGWNDAINEKSLASDKDNQNIKKVSDTEYRWERTPPLGKSWLVDIMFMVGKEKWSCGTGITGTFTSEAMLERIATICKSIKKK